MIARLKKIGAKLELSKPLVLSGFFLCGVLEV